MQTNVITVSAKGQIVIPRDVRRRLQIQPGRKLLIKVEGDSAVMTLLPEDPVEHFCGIFKEETSLTAALLEERRKECDDEGRKIAR